MEIPSESCPAQVSDTFIQTLEIAIWLVPVIEGNTCTEREGKTVVERVSELTCVSVLLVAHAMDYLDKVYRRASNLARWNGSSVTPPRSAPWVRSRQVVEGIHKELKWFPQQVVGAKVWRWAQSFRDVPAMLSAAHYQV